VRINRISGYQQIESKTKHTLIAGLSNSGKGMYGEWYVPKFVKKGFKVFDMNSESRGEGMLYSIKQNDFSYLRRLSYLTNDIVKPEAYKNEIIMFLGHNLKDIQVLPKNVKLCVFNENWLDNEDLKKLLAFNDPQSQFMDTIFELHGDKKIPLRYLYNFLKNAARSKDSEEAVALKQAGTHAGIASTIKRRIRSLLRSGLFHNSKEDMENHFEYLNLAESLKQTDTITSFSTYLINDLYIRYVCINVLLKKFIELLERRQTTTPIVFYIREGNDFFYMEDPQPYQVSIQNSIDKILRKGRSLGGSEVVVVMDTQLLNDLPISIFMGFDKFICFKLPTRDSMKLTWKADIPELYLKFLSKVKVGVGMIIAAGNFQYPIKFLPTSHKKADRNFDVFQYLISVYGEKDYSKTQFLNVTLLQSEDDSEFDIPSEYFDNGAKTTSVSA
jgi:hypothetical protein